MEPYSAVTRRALLLCHAVLGPVTGLLFLGDALTGRLDGNPAYAPLPSPALWFLLPIFAGVTLGVGLMRRSVRLEISGLAFLTTFYVVQSCLFLRQATNADTPLGPAGVYALPAALLLLHGASVLALRDRE